MHEGPIAVSEGTLKEFSYSDLQQKDGKVEASTVGGWLGFADKYWLVTLVPDQQTEVKTRFAHTASNGVDRYQADYLRPAVNIAPGGRADVTDRLFAGAKEVLLLDRYEADLGIAASTARSTSAGSTS